MRFFKSIKFRLTVLYLIALVIPLLGFGVGAYYALSQNLHRNLDELLKTRAAELQRSVEMGAGSFATQEILSELVGVYDASGVQIHRLGPNIQFVNMGEAVTHALLGESSFRTAVSRDGQRVRLYAAPFSETGNTRSVIIVGRALGTIDSVLDTFRSILGLTAIILIFMAGVGGIFLTKRMLKPVDWIIGTAQKIDEAGLKHRIDLKSEDELGALAKTLNGMMERLEGAFNRQRQFTTDASHELRTPLAVIQAESSLALDKERTVAEYKKSLELVSQEVAYMSSVIGRLLFLARSDAGKEPLNFKNVNLKELLLELASDIDVLARDKDLDFNLGLLDNVTIMGDRVQLRQMFLNILENAVKYTPGGGSVSASITRKGENAVVAISDTGIGIPEAHMPNIFERFYRVDKARSRAERGSGLGLSIAKCIAELHGGKIEAESKEGQGSTFKITLPLKSVPSLANP